MGESRHRDRRGPRRHHPLRRRLCGLGGDLLPGGWRVRERGVHAVRPLATSRAALVRNTRRRASRRPEHLRVWIGRALSLLPASASGHPDGARRARTGSIGREARTSPRSPEPWQRPAVDRHDPRGRARGRPESRQVLLDPRRQDLPRSARRSCGPALRPADCTGARRGRACCRRTWTRSTRSRALAVDVLACPHCGARLRLIGTLHVPAVIRKLLAHLGWSVATAPRVAGVRVWQVV